MGKSIHDLREMLCEELENMTEKRGALTADRLKLIDMLTHSIKSIDTIVAMEDSGYSNGRSYTSRRSDGRYTRDDRYSRDDVKTHLMRQLEDMMDEVHSDKEREAIRRCMEQMS